jgi:PLP dependent protein
MIKENLEQIQEKIFNIKNKLGIKYSIDLMAVSKTRSKEEISVTMDCGQKLFGENRVNEAFDKFGSDLLKNKDFSLHIIGHLQRNKIKQAVEISTMIQSIDKIETLEVLEKICREKNKKIDYLIEINTSSEPQKFGVREKEYFKFLENVLNNSYIHCNLRGLMTVGPLTDDNESVRKSFKLLFDFFNKTKIDINKNDFNIISMGMSSDFEVAIEEGANLVRIGTLIFGNRIFENG